MSTKTKHQKSATSRLAETAQQAGLVLMTVAVTLGMVELSEHPGARIVLPNQPAMALAGEHEGGNNPIRREKEEAGPHYVSYSVAQRTPGRAGRI